ncbi:MAG: peptide chain release factor aRF-1 [Candidatus Wukongarchaeota archaeon]|nr:peptide chain release factor aRF-1 [Candidatus Wukongarchaeota archaeon]
MNAQVEAKKSGSLERYLLEKELEELEKKKSVDGSTCLISLYIPPERQISDFVQELVNELGTATNIKSKTTRKNVQSALNSLIARLKMLPTQAPEKGLVLFCGVTEDGKMEFHNVPLVEPVRQKLYVCDSSFHTEHLREQLKEKETYGLIVMDRSAATFAFLKGKHLNVLKTIYSHIMGKHRAGGQSARRFERLIEEQAHNFMKEVGELGKKVFLEDLEEEDLKAIIIGGPGSTKEDFYKGTYLDNRVKEKVVDLVDTGYTEEEGIKELVERSANILQNLRYMEEKRIVQKFLEQLAKDTGYLTYGEREIREALQQGAVDTLILSEGLDKVRIKIQCQSCDYEEEKTLPREEVEKEEEKLAERHCPKCKSSLLSIIEKTDIVKELGELAEETGTSVEIISTDTEEGTQLLNAFGGLAAILRYKTNHS